MQNARVKLTSQNGHRRIGSRRILYVAYPLLPVTCDSPGGAEQVLANVERQAVRHGYQTTVACCNGSEVAGGTYVTGAPGSGALRSAEKIEQRHCENVMELVSVREAIGCGFDLIHDHSGSFFGQAHRLNTPVLATLHLPRSFYPEHWFKRVPDNLYFNCVSRAQMKTFAGVPHVISSVPNGIMLERFAFAEKKTAYVLWLGRICEEKGPHIAMDAAAEAGCRIVIAGTVYPFSYHQMFFEREIASRLREHGEAAELVEAPSFDMKVELLRNARAVIISSQVDESSSLVAMEAAACGTPAVAFRRGALPEVVQHGVTGFLVRSQAEMVSAIREARSIRPRACREHAEENFSAESMFAGYERLYEKVLASMRQRKHTEPLAA